MERSLTMRIGFWSSVALAFLGVVYLAVLAVHLATAGFASPQSPFVESASGLITILTALCTIVIFAVIAHLSPPEKRVLGMIGLCFTVLFTAMVSINRFVQLTVIRQSTPAEQASDLARFLPYAEGSLMFALEMLGWGLFSSLASWAIAPIFAGSGLQRAIRWLLVLYGVFSSLAVVGFATETMVGAGAFVAWGPILLVLSVCLAVLFRRGEQLSVGGDASDA